MRGLQEGLLTPVEAFIFSVCVWKNPLLYSLALGALNRNDLMMHLGNDVSPFNQFTHIERYYRFNSKIYDASRWTFLFGRATLIERLSANQPPTNILEVGCGTGKNLINLCRNFPKADVTGLDISEDMLKVAGKKLDPFTSKVTLLHKPYSQPLQPARSFDLVLFSYCLSMINPGWEHAIECAYCDLAQGGLIAVVDFNDSRFPLLNRWMRLNHVRMDGHLLPELKSCFQPRTFEILRAYGGVWTYFKFLGEK
jgi:S-adenosylmethionine-diacylgycerolhomoserine-N-methlytransferase